MVIRQLVWYILGMPRYTRSLPDIHPQPSGPRASGVPTHAHGITITYILVARYALCVGELRVTTGWIDNLPSGHA